MVSMFYKCKECKKIVTTEQEDYKIIETKEMCDDCITNIETNDLINFNKLQNINESLKKQNEELKKELVNSKYELEEFKNSINPVFLNMDDTLKIHWWFTDNILYVETYSKIEYDKGNLLYNIVANGSDKPFYQLDNNILSRWIEAGKNIL